MSLYPKCSTSNDENAKDLNTIINKLIIFDIRINIYNKYEILIPIYCSMALLKAKITSVFLDVGFNPLQEWETR